MEFPKCSKDASSLAKRVSLLNFEPKVSKFPVIGTAMPFQSLLLRGNSFFVYHHRMRDVLEIPFCMGALKRHHFVVSFVILVHSTKSL